MLGHLRDLDGYSVIASSTSSRRPRCANSAPIRSIPCTNSGHSDGEMVSPFRLPGENQTGEIGHEHGFIIERTRQEDLVLNAVAWDGQPQVDEGLLDHIRLWEERRHNGTGTLGCAHIR